ncbi:MAG: hypothetical protein ACF8NJ_11010 [Phycisphaerales bacterium JB038]
MSAKIRHDAGTLYNIAVHEAGHAVMVVHQGGFRPNGAKGARIRSIRKFAKRCEKVLGFIEDSIDDDIESIRQWILDEGWFMPRVYRLADVFVEKRKMEAEEILRWFILDGEYRWLKPAA